MLSGHGCKRMITLDKDAKEGHEYELHYFGC
ncbi:hypothetical protein J2Z66_001672 [Paenibacillus eucommiae]|uniref:Uncharacterized protein n=1 Tax=Paenibacillus eucommiae TaxID=1355755 RepID=A0ABS4IU26_9BACL|nr:hypothetical protein [Paenibacillus eucommiae]